METMQELTARLRLKMARLNRRLNEAEDVAKRIEIAIEQRDLERKTNGLRGEAPRGSGE